MSFLIGFEPLVRVIQIDRVYEVERYILYIVEVVIVVAQVFKLFFAPVEYLCHSLPDIDLAFYLNVLKRLLSESVFAKCATAFGYGTLRGTVGEDAIHARFAHFVVTFWIDEEAKFAVEIAAALAYWAYLQ